MDRRRNRNQKLNVKKVSVFKRLRPHPRDNNSVNDDDSFNSSSSSSPPLVVVTGMPSDCTVMELKSRFELFGQISRTRIDSNDGAGYVTFRSSDSVEAALSASHDSESGIEIRSKKQFEFGNFEFDDAEVIGSTGITMYSSGSWTNQEDYDLCYIWCHFSVDTIRGNDQSGDTFWGKIAANFNKRHPEKKRSLSSLKGRFGKINRQTQCFESQIYKVKQQNPSGLGGEMSLRQKANELFLKNHLPENKHLPHYYQYMHCYEVLIRHPKWNSNNAKSIQSVQTKSKGKQKAQKTGFNSSPGDSESGRDSNYVDITAGDDSMTSAGEDFRPPGVKASKKKINVATYLEEKLSAASERMAKVTEDRNIYQVERMGIMKDFVSIERKKEERQVIKMELEQKKEERELRKMELDRQMYEDSVMRMDLSALEDEDKEYWQDRKQEIRASRKNRR